MSDYDDTLIDAYAALQEERDDANTRAEDAEREVARLREAFAAADLDADRGVMMSGVHERRADAERARADRLAAELEQATTDQETFDYRRGFLAALEQVLDVLDGLAMRMSVGPGGTRRDEWYVLGWADARTKADELIRDLAAGHAADGPGAEPPVVAVDK